MTQNMWFYDSINLVLESTSIFFGHPFVIAITIFFLSKHAVNRIIPDKKEKTLDKFISLKNKFDEAKMKYNSIVNSKKIITNEKEKQYFIDALYEEIPRLSIIINEDITKLWVELDNDLQFYYNDKELKKIHAEYSKKIMEVYHFFTYTLLEEGYKFEKNIDEMTDIFKNINELEKKWIGALSKARSLHIKTN